MSRSELLRCYLLHAISRRSEMLTSWNRKKLRGIEGDKANEFLKQSLLSDVPIAFIRPGFAEVDDFFYYDETVYWPPNGIHRREKKLRGLFDNDDDYQQYQRNVRKGFSDVDAFFLYENYQYQYLYKTYFKNIPAVDAGSIIALKHSDPWTKSLAGKKVLILSVFSEKIKEQYSRIEKVFPKYNPWPDFNLVTVQSIWSLPHDSVNSRFKSYFDELKYLFNECMKEDFEVALLCCGKFGIELAPMLKREGKKAIQIGGDLQVMFGIKGRRWDEIPNFVRKYYNEYWIRASIEETGANEIIAKKCDNGCYW